jgi:pyruvate dehydrogenase E1 component beta subunit
VANPKRLNMVQAINLAMHQEMKRDADVLAMGQDIGVNGGVFRVTDGLLDAFGEKRVVDTPLSESGIVGSAVGMAMAGLKPIAEIQFSGFALLAFSQLEGAAARYRSRTHSKITIPLVVRMPYGGGVRALEHHSESREAAFASLVGLKVVIPSTPRNARGLLVAAIRDPDPVVYMEPKHSYRAFREEVPEEEEVFEIGKADIRREGSDLTVVAWGAMMPTTLKAVDAIQEARGIKVEVIDLLTISPLDAATIIASVKKTGRCVIVQEAARSFGVSSEIVARINDEALDHLEAPVGRVTSYDVVMPFFQREQLYMPDVSRIAHGIEQTLDYV